MVEQPERNGKTGGGKIAAPPAYLATRSSGQIAVMFALSMLAIIPLMGLVFDGGNIYVQRRTVQNAADAAALAGTRALMKATVAPGTTEAPTAPELTVADAVCKYLAANSFGTDAQHIPTATAYFVDIDGVTLVSGNLLPANCVGSSANIIPGTAAGVRVDATIGPFFTFIAGFLGRGIAGADGAGIAQSTTKATATVQAAAVIAFQAYNAPFMICGVDTKLVAPYGTTHSILMMSSPTVATVPAQIDATQVGKNFWVHLGIAPHITTCNETTSFTGLADMGLNSGLSALPADLVDRWGVGAVSSVTTVDGINGCAPGQDNNCIMMIPVAIPSLTGGVVTGPGGPTHGLTAVLWAAFKITKSFVPAGHQATLQSGYSVGGGPEAFTWTYATKDSVSATAASLRH